MNTVDTVDPQLRDEQAGFRQNRSCTDQIATLQIIVEQSLEWNSSLYINSIDFEKTLDSVDRETLWRLLRNYDIPIKIVNLIRKSYEGMSCRVIHGGLKQLPGANRSPIIVTIPVSTCYRLDYEEIYQGKKEWNSMDLAENIWMT